MTQRPLLYLLIFLTVPLLLGSLLAPWIFLGIQKLVTIPFFHGLAEERFERVATRSVQVIALLLVWPCLSHSGTVHRVAPALRWSATRGRSFLQWAAIGIGMVVVVYIAGFFFDTYTFDPKHWGTLRMLTRPLSIFLGALLVGLLEEYLFRGFIFGVLRSRFSFATAALISSAFFACIHFLRPRLPAPLEEITWSSGFQLFPHMFTLFRPAYDWDFALTLFFMAVSLCALLARHGHLYGIAGLHVGWVWALQTGNSLINQTPRHHSFWFGWGDNASQGALVTFFVAILTIYTWRTRQKTSPPPAPN